MNEERRENHEDCPAGEDNRERKYIRRVNGGEIWFCHNCGLGGFVVNGLSTPSDTIRNVIRSRADNIKSTLEQVVRDIQLPRDVSNNIPPLGLGWLYKYYITDEEIKQFGICYSEQYNRLILPVYRDDKLIYWQGRNLNPPYTKDNPKYLNIRQSGAKSVFFKRHSIHYTIDTLVVVEDILSAIRVGRFCNSLALLGSYFPNSLLNEFRDYSTIVIYLDADKYLSAIKAATKFNQLTGKRFIVLQHQLDPKELTSEALEDFINGSL